jgi:hypothetical protein
MIYISINMQVKAYRNTEIPINPINHMMMIGLCWKEVQHITMLTFVGVPCMQHGHSASPRGNLNYELAWCVAVSLIQPLSSTSTLSTLYGTKIKYKKISQI